MRLQFFQTEDGEVYLDDGGGLIEPRARDWAAEIGIRFARISSFPIAFKSPAFNSLEKAMAWYEQHMKEAETGEGEWEDGIPGDYSEWGSVYVGRVVSAERFLLAEEWAAADEEGGSVLGFWLPPGTCFAMFPPRGGSREPDVFVVVFLDVEDLTVLGVYDSVWFRDEWDECHPMADRLSLEDITRAKKLIEAILEPVRPSR